MPGGTEADQRAIEALKQLVAAGDGLVAAIDAFAEIRPDGKMILTETQARIIQNAANQFQSERFSFFRATIPSGKTTPVTPEFMAVVVESLACFVSFRTNERDRLRAGLDAMNAEPGDEPGAWRVYKRFDVGVLIEHV